MLYVIIGTGYVRWDPVLTSQMDLLLACVGYPRLMARIPAGCQPTEAQSKATRDQSSALSICVHLWFSSA